MHILKYIALAVLAFFLIWVGSARAQVVPAQNQIIPSAYFGQGYLISTSTSPTHKLGANLVDLAGSFITGILGISHGGTGISTTPTLGQVLVGNASGGYTLTSTTTAGAFGYWNASGNNIYKNNSANVGIGSTSPTGLLTVQGAGNAITQGIRVLNTNDSTNHYYDIYGGWDGNFNDRLQFAVNGSYIFGIQMAGISMASGKNYYVTGNAGLVSENNSNTQIMTESGNALSLYGLSYVRNIVAGTEIARTTTTGFGVGTTSPFVKLSIAGDTYLGGNLTATGTVSILPLATPAGAFLAVNPQGVVIATTTPSGSGGTPGGLNTQVQYNNAGSFGGISGATTNGTIISLTNALLGGATLTTSSVNGVTLTAAGSATSYLNGTGAYSVPVGTTYTATYPVTLTGTAFGLAFGTTTSNTWAGTQTFTNTPVFSTLGAGTVNATAGGTIYSTATSTPTVTAPITYSGTLGQFVGGSSGTFDCTSASGSVKGCLTSTDWNTFNNKQAAISVTAPLRLTGATIDWTGLATTTQPSSSNLLVSNGLAGVYGVATTSVSCSGTVSCTGFNVLGASPITITGSGAASDEKWATSTLPTLGIYPNSALYVGIGTTTPRWPLQIASSTTSQLGLSDGTVTSPIWNFRAIGSTLYIGTSSPSTFATSSVSAISITSQASTQFGVGTTSPWTTIGFVGTGAWSGLGSPGATKNTLCIDATTSQIFQNAAATCTASSRRFKHDIRDIDINPTEALLAMKPSAFTYNDGGAKNIGFIAEDLYLIDPRLATLGPDGKPYSIDEPGIMAVIVGALQANFEKDENQDEEIAALKAEVAKLEAGNKRESYVCSL